MTEATRELATRADTLALRSDLAVFRAEIRGDLYRAPWILGRVLLTTMAALGAGAAVITALS